MILASMEGLLRKHVGINLFRRRDSILKTHLTQLRPILNIFFKKVTFMVKQADYTRSDVNIISIIRTQKYV